MNARSSDGLPQSVKQRLLNISNQEGEPFNPLLVRYGVERLLYRLTQTPHAKDFVLKGATLFAVWTGKPHRPTQDVDLLGLGAPDVDRLVEVFQDVCRATVVPDGLVFDAESVAAAPIREDNIYDGVRVRLTAMLGKARISLQVDVGFGDVVTPEPDERSVGPLLDFPAPVLRAYRRETVVAEKLHAIVVLGMANSRMKDYFDLWTMCHTMEFGGPTLLQAVRATFERRATPALAEMPVGLTDAFAVNAAKQSQWAAFVRKMGSRSSVPDLSEVVTAVAAFLAPIVRATGSGEALGERWTPPGPWRSTAP